MPHKSLHLWEKLAEARNAMLKAGLWELYDNYPFEKKMNWGFWVHLPDS